MEAATAKQPAASSCMIKVRHTTNVDTWTVPHNKEAQEKFFEGDWEVIHVVFKSNNALLNVFTRDQVIEKLLKSRTAKAISGMIVNVLPVCEHVDTYFAE